MKASEPRLIPESKYISRFSPTACVIGYKVSIEAGSTEPWKQLIGNNGLCFGLDDFGKSAPYKDIFKHFGLTSENISDKIKEMFNK
mgnify:CR=1 FL=1